MSHDDLLPEYERELALLRSSLGEFAQRYPRVAARLAISGEHSEDPHVERLIQSAALLNARASARINDDFHEFTTALLEILYPEYLRPFPACSIAHFGGTSVIEKLTSPAVIERGAELRTRTGEYIFRTAYDVVFTPLRITDARYVQPSSIPRNIRLHEGTTGVLSVTFATLTQDRAFDSAIAQSVRIFVEGDRHTVAAAMDAMLLRASSALVEADGSGKWLALDAVPVASVGFGSGEALIERRGDEQSPFRLLLEYFSFPQKFDFIDVDLSMLLQAVGPCCNVTLHLPVRDLHRDSAPALHLASLSSANFKLFCSPVINLFACAAEPISLEDLQIPVYPVVPKTLNASSASVYWIDDVRLSEQASKGTSVTCIPPYRSLMHHAAPQRAAVFWLAYSNGRLAESLPGQDMLLSLVDSTGSPIEPSGKQIDADLMCTNGNLPASLQVGDPRGDFVYAETTLAERISMLYPPTESVTRPKREGQMWELISMISANPVNLSQAGLPAFKALLGLHVPSRSTSAARHIDGMMHLSHQTALEWMQMDPSPMFVRGIRMCFAVNDVQLGDCAISVFVHILESIFVRYLPETGFVQVAVTSARNGAELARGQPLAGEVAVI